MIKKENNYAFIDGNNLHRGVDSSGWVLDYRRFRIFLKEKHGVERAYIFIGLVPRFKDLYTRLQEAGFTLVFKETTQDADGKIKGNCDTDLVLEAVVGFYEKRFTKAIVVASDGDYACIVKFLKTNNVFQVLISPSDKLSFLLRRLNVSITYLNTKRGILENKFIKKAPIEDGTSIGSFS